MEHRDAAGQRWQLLHTSRGGADVYVASLPYVGQYALVFLRATPTSGRGGVPVLPLVLGGAVVLLGAAVVVVRVRSRATTQAV